MKAAEIKRGLGEIRLLPHLAHNILPAVTPPDLPIN